MNGATGLILSGGGARGAYETGVLSYVYGDFARREGRLPGVDVIAGSSVGAVNGTFLAAAAADPIGGLRRLCELWYQLDFTKVLSFGLRELTLLPRVWLGGRRSQGVFDATPLMKLVGKHVPWVTLRRNLREGTLRALTVTTTHVATGRPHVWLDQAPSLPSPPDLGRRVVMRRGPILPRHVMASAAIPLVFPAVSVGGELHYDGGLRLNTPTAPAIHLGADRLFIVGLSSEEEGEPISIAPDRAPGAPFLLGKVLDAFFLDHLDQDLREIDRVNEYMAMGLEAYGADFIDRMNEGARRLGVPERRPVRYLAVRPSVDLGRIASDQLQSQKWKSPLGQRLLSMVDVGEAAEADLASFLLFDAQYVRVLIELGRRDAAARHDELADFFFAER